MNRAGVALAGVAAVGILWWSMSDGPDQPPQPTPTSSTVQPSTANPAQTPTPSKEDTPTLDPAAPTVDQDAAAASLAVEAITAWQSPTTNERQARLAPIATPVYLDAAASIDPTQVPASKVTGTTVDESGDGLTTVTVTLADTTQIAVDITADNLVYDIRPA